MFKENKILRKLLMVAGILLVLFIGLVIAWQICVGRANRKYTLSGMELMDREMAHYLLVGDMGEYYNLFQVPFPSFDLNRLQLSVSFGDGGEADDTYLPATSRVKGYPDLEVYSATFDIFPNRKLEDGRYMVFLTVWDHSNDERYAAGMCVDAQGNYYLPPGVMRDEETQNLARAYLDSEWKEYLIRMAKEAWGEDLFKEE